MLHGEPNITWKSSEVKSLIVQENLQYAVVGKFSYGRTDIKELRRSIPGQCGIKSECTIGVLDARHILIRLTSLEDYVHILSNAAVYVKTRDNYWQMRTLKWDPWFEPDVETPIGVAWISFPDLPPNFLAKDAIFSIAAAVGKPLTVDMATKNQTRPSCAKVKIEVDLTARLPQRVRITEEDDVTGETKFKWVKVQYDYMPKYCKECCLQGHNEHNCWTIHPELYEEKKEHEENKGEKNAKSNVGEQRKVLTSGKVIDFKKNRQEYMARATNIYKRDKYGHIEGLNEMNDGNSFDALGGKEDQEAEDEGITKGEQNTKEWVDQRFGKVEEMKKNNVKQGVTEDQCNKEEEAQKKKQRESEEKLQVIEYNAQNENEGMEKENMRAIEVYESNNEEVLPLAVQADDKEEGISVRAEIHKDDQEETMNQKGINEDKSNLEPNIDRIAIEGDLSPKQVKKLKGSLIKSKKQSGEDSIAAQASSRSKRVIIKNPKYQ